MKRVSSAKSEHLKPVLLYKDDVSEIFRIFERGCEETTVTSGGYEMESIGELEELNRNVVHDLRFNGSNPYVTLDLKPDNIHLYISEDTHHQLGIYKELKEFIHEKRRRLSWITQSSLGPGIIVGMSFQYFPSGEDVASPKHNIKDTQSNSNKTMPPQLQRDRHVI